MNVLDIGQNGKYTLYTANYALVTFSNVAEHSHSDVLIPSLFRFDPRAFRWALTMKLAVEEINNSTELLPNHTLGYKIFDSCAYPLTGQRAALAVMNGPVEADRPMCSSASPMLAIIGESGSAQSIVVSRILRPFRIPMVCVRVYIYIYIKCIYICICIFMSKQIFLMYIQ